MAALLGLLTILAVFGILTVADRWAWLDNFFNFDPEWNDDNDSPRL